jgi:hypothetical protein
MEKYTSKPAQMAHFKHIAHRLLLAEKSHKLPDSFAPTRNFPM